MDKYSKIINDPKFSELSLNTSIYSKSLEHWEKLLNYLISKSSPINKAIDRNVYELICVTYDNLLYNFPLCENYHIDYALLEYKLSHLSKFHKIFNNALFQFNYRSLHLWQQYLTLCNDIIVDNKRLFKLYERAEGYIGLHFHSGEFWHLYLNQVLLRQGKDNKIRYVILLRKIIEIPIYKFSEFYLIWLNEIDQIRDLKQLIKFVPRDELVSKWKVDIHYNGRRGPLLQEAKRNLKKMTKELYMVIQYQTMEIYNLFESKITIQYYTSMGTLISHEQMNVWLQYVEFVINLNIVPWIEIIFQRSITVLAHYETVWLKYCDWLIEYKNDTLNAQEILLQSLKFVSCKINILKKLYSVMISNNKFGELEQMLEMIQGTFQDKIEQVEEFEIFWDFIQCRIFIMSGKGKAGLIMDEILKKIKLRLGYGSKKKGQEILLNYMIQLKINGLNLEDQIFKYLVSDCPERQYYLNNDQFWTCYSKLVFYDTKLGYLDKRRKICQDLWSQIPSGNNFTHLRSFCEEYLPEEEASLNKILTQV